MCVKFFFVNEFHSQVPVTCLSSALLMIIDPFSSKSTHLFSALEKRLWEGLLLTVHAWLPERYESDYLSLKLVLHFTHSLVNWQSSHGFAALHYIYSFCFRNFCANVKALLHWSFFKFFTFSHNLLLYITALNLLIIQFTFHYPFCTH